MNKQKKIIDLPDYLMILTRVDSVIEAENRMNLKMLIILEWAQNNKIKFNERNQMSCLCLAGEQRKERR